MTKPTLESIAKVLVVNERYEALILTVGEYKGHPEKSFKPDLPGGIVNPGESELDAVVRELQEESGIVAEAGSMKLVFAKTEFFELENKSVTKSLFLLNLSTTPEVILSWEHAGYQWVSLDNLRNDIELSPFYKEAVLYCFSNNLL